jgi:hypothetical protein
MKKTLISILSLAILLSSCSDSFLDLPSETSLSTTTFYKTESDFQQGVNAAYAPLRSVYNGTTGVNISGAWAMGEMHSDNTYYIHNPGYRALVDGEAIANFTVQASNSISTAKYVADYQVIARANQVLAPIDGVTFGTSSKNNIKGQAFFLRALAYFDLVQYYGKVPLHLNPVTDRNGADYHSRKWMLSTIKSSKMLHKQRVYCLPNLLRKQVALLWVHQNFIGKRICCSEKMVSSRNTSKRNHRFG